MKKTSGRHTTYPFHKPEENHPPGKDDSKKISEMIGKAAKYANSAKTKKAGGMYPLYKRCFLASFSKHWHSNMFPLYKRCQVSAYLWLWHGGS